ncbi:MAG TPA: 5-oxoprolinase/urea amidolyase family protein [Nakamurella sp.]
MRARLLPCGDAALLVEVDGIEGVEGVLALMGALRAADPAGVADLVPAARTVLVRVDPGADIDALRSAVAEIVRDADAAGDGSADSPDVVIPVRYDGPDLDEVGRQTGLSRSEIIARHTGTRWRAGFVGFAPGFAYLTGGDPRLSVSRRPQSRTQVPAGSVALAGGYSAVYPQASPGGWQLIGRTGTAMWDLGRTPPALVQPGSWVRFVDDPDGAAGTGADAADAAGPVVADEAPSAADGASLEVLRTGPLSAFQDLGRTGCAGLGVGRSGAADRSSFAAANRLVGNPVGAAAIESVLGGLVLRALDDVLIAVTGATVPLTMDGDPVEYRTALGVRAGQVVRLGAPAAGLRSYLAVRGGFAVAPVLGSRSTDTLSGLGPPPLRRGDRLAVRSPADGNQVSLPPLPDDEPFDMAAAETLPLRVIAGPRDGFFANAGDLAVGDWVVSPNSNRVGLRLDRPDGVQPARAPGLRRADDRELPSEGLVPGAVQVPPGGQPVLFLADHPVTGGYPVVAVVCSADLDRAAQARPGRRLTFRFETTRGWVEDGEGPVTDR